MFRDQEGDEIAIGVDKIIYVGPPEQEDDKGRKKPGFK